MELSIIRRETTGTPPNQYNESETLVRFEVFAALPSSFRLNQALHLTIRGLDYGWLPIARYVDDLRVRIFYTMHLHA